MTHLTHLVRTQSLKVLSLAVLLVIALTMTAAPAAAQGPSGPTPNVGCIINNGDGTYTASFGYSQAPNGTLIAIGPNNFFSPEPIDRGQPTSFTTGNQTNVVFADFVSGGSVTWTIINTQTKTATANNASAPCAPEANDDSYNVTPGVQRVVSAPGVLANDQNNSNNQLTAALVSTTASGTLTFNASGAFSYTPNLGFTGIDTFTYQVSDGINTSNIATVTLTVEAFAPNATADAYNTPFNTPLNVDAPGVLANDTDPNADVLTAVLVSGPGNAASFTLNADGSFSYTPNATFSGIDNFTYKANDGGQDSSTVSVSITVANAVPVANDDSYNTAFETTLSVNAPGVIFNDTDGNNQPLTATLVQGPDESSAFSLNANGSFSYTPNDAFSGVDTFTYTVSDGTATSNVATVSITVANSIPVGQADSYNTAFNTPITVNAPGVLENDSDGNGETLTAELVSGPSNAANFLLSANGAFTYTPTATFSGADSFTYRAFDGSDYSSNVTVTITVANSVPVATADSYNAAFNTQLVVNVPGVLANDTDANLTTLTADLVSGPSNAANFLLSSNGSFSYTPNSTFSGEDSFSYRAFDGVDYSNTVSVTITVANGVPVANNDSYNTLSNTPLSVDAPGVLDNDTDGNNQSLSATLVAGPAHASSFSLNADGSFSYTPVANYAGQDSFTYTASDGLDSSNTATVTISVVNTAPSVTNDEYSAAFNTPINVSAPGVLDNDSDAEGQSITAVLVSGPSNAASFNLNADGSFSYTPNATFSGTDSFTYAANDGITNSSAATVFLTIGNAVPVANGDSYNVVFGFDFTEAAPGVLANDTDANQTALTAVLVSGPAHAASFNLNADGSFSFVGEDLYVGADSFTYYATDGQDNSNTVTVNITIGVPTPRQRVLPASGMTMDTGYFPLIWGHKPGVMWYHNVLVDDANVTIYSKWVEAAQVCDIDVTLICRVDYHWIKNSVYTWYLGTWQTGDTKPYDYNTSTFIVNASAPVAVPRVFPTNGHTYTTAPDGVSLQWQAGHQDAWYQVQVRNAANTLVYNQWHERETVCDMNTNLCEVGNRWWQNGTYTWTMRAWSPTGMGPQDTSSLTLDVPKVVPVVRLSPADLGSVTAGSATLTWEHQAEASWYRVVLVGPTAHDQWYRASTINCGSGTCSVTLDLAAGSYKWWMVAWGPGGMGTWTGVSNFTAQ